MSATRAAALTLRGISKRFGDTQALADADLEVAPGSIHALLGENGAGKTTLMRVAYGLARPDAGTIAVDGVPRAWGSSAEAIAAGVGMVHQHFSLVPAMTVAQNVALSSCRPFDRFDPAETGALVRRVAAEAGLDIDPAAVAADLSVAGQQRLEIVKALARDVRLLILDEPTAVLTPAEGEDLFAWLKAFVARGASVVLITHKVREVLQVAGAVTILRGGRTVKAATGGLSERDVVAAMLGVTPDDALPMAGVRATGSLRDVVLRLDDVSAAGASGRQRMTGVSLAVRGGEVLAVAGVEGAGQQVLLRVLAGRLAVQRGTVSLPARIGFVPEDRRRDALIPEFTLIENLALRGAGSRRGRMPWRAIASDASHAIQAFDVRAAAPEAPASSLSGGNQQKLVLARELGGDPQALVVENPTRGLDVRATRDILRRLGEARDRGLAVVVYSSDLDELAELGDRAVVCYGGRIQEVAVDVAEMGRAMVGST